MSSIQFLDADDLAACSPPGMVLLFITRAEVEQQRWVGIVERLRALSRSQESALQYQGSVRIVVDGYNDDPRELGEIPEVKFLFRKLTQEWPCWFWFLERGIGQMTLLLSLLSEVVVRFQETNVAHEIVNVDEYQTTILKLSDSCFKYLMPLGISHADINHSMNSAIADVIGEPF